MATWVNVSGELMVSRPIPDVRDAMVDGLGIDVKCITPTGVLRLEGARLVLRRAA
jgi:hypothetical protein